MVIDCVTRIFSAAGRLPGHSDFRTYGDALEDIDSDLLTEAVRLLVARVDLANDVRPSPALVRETAYGILRRRPQVPALPEDTSPVASPEVVAEWRAKIRAQLATSRGPLAPGLRLVKPIRTEDEG